MKEVKKILLFDAGGSTGKDWYIEYYHQGKRKRVKGFNEEKDPGKRRELATIKMAEIAREIGAIPTEKIDKVDLLANKLRAYILDHSHEWRKKTLQTYQSKCNVLIEWMKNHNHSDFKEKEAKLFEAYLRKEVSKTTFNAYVRTLKAVWNDIYPNDVNLFDWNRYKGNNKTPALYFQTYQRQRIALQMAEKQPNLWLFVQFIFYTFIRPGELRQLKVSDIYPEERKILIRAEIAKNKKRAFVHIPSIFFEEIMKNDILSFPQNDYIFSTNNKPGPFQVSINFFALQHQKFIKEMGFDTEKYKLYSWKHTGAIACYRAGMKVKDIQLQMRHASLEETDGYLRSLGISDVASDFDSIFPKL